MKKDVIYIDVEDDITSVIEKLKSSGEKIVALVPPKGSSVLQSVVNLKLLKRAADSSGKQPVIVTNNQALLALAGGASLYAAKNLQSKPTIPGKDTIDELPDDEVEVSDAVGTMADPDVQDDDVELTDEELAGLTAEDGTGSVPLKGADTKPKSKKTKKIPNFDSFRKKLLVGGGIAAVILVVSLLLFGRTKTSVVLRAETTPVDVQFDATVDTGLSSSDPASYKLKASTQEQKKTVTQSFTPTGQKDLGTKASGDMTFAIKCSDVTSFPTTIPAGTTVTASGLSFVTDSKATLSTPGSGGGCQFTGNTTVTSKENGDKYNLSARSYSVSGYSKVTGTGSDMTGGTSRIVTVVSQDDVNKATEALKAQDTSAVRKDLQKAFGDSIKPLDDSFTVVLANVSSEPGVDSEANSASLTAEATYTMLGVGQDDLSNAMNEYIKTQMTNPGQQSVYDNGYSNVKLVKKSGDEKSAVYTVTSTAQYGPQFDTDALAKEIAGNKAGEARSTLQSLPGVKSVDINLTPFWASKLPDASRINIKIDVDQTVSG